LLQLGNAPLLAFYLDFALLMLAGEAVQDDSFERLYPLFRDTDVCPEGYLERSFLRASSQVTGLSLRSFQ